MKIWNFANFFTEDVKKNHIFPQFFRYIAIYLIPVGGQLCVLGEYILLVSLFDDIVDSRHSEADLFSEPWMYRLKESSPYSESTSLQHFY
jgi:hypothetical protein